MVRVCAEYHQRLGAICIEIPFLMHFRPRLNGLNRPCTSFQPISRWYLIAAQGQ
jgi:hypothetical protein